jgi:hypothetical protein
MEAEFIKKWELVQRELSELERLAEIGRAIELVFKKGGWIQIPLEHDIDTAEDLLELLKLAKEIEE